MKSISILLARPEPVAAVAAAAQIVRRESATTAANHRLARTKCRLRELQREIRPHR